MWWVDAEEGTYFKSSERISSILRPLFVMGREENEVTMAWISVWFLDQQNFQQKKRLHYRIETWTPVLPPELSCRTSRVALVGDLTDYLAETRRVCAGRLGSMLLAGVSNTH